MDESFRIIAVILLIFATAFFVIAEFAFVKVRSSRIDQLVAEGDKRAIRVQKILNNLDGYLSACQLGITITALGLGWLGEPTIQRLLNPLLTDLNINQSISSTISFILSFSIITFLHVVLGELAPKTVAIQKAEEISLKVSSSMVVFYKIMYPFIWVLNGSANLIIRAFGMKVTSEHNEEHSEEEIKLIVSSSNDINKDEKNMVEKIFDFDETLVREIMVHRKEMKCIYETEEYETIVEFVKSSRFSRFPVCGEDKDDIKGYVNIRDIYSNNEKEKNLNSIIREIPRVYESMPIKKVLQRLQLEKTQIAVVIDEYGGISGLVTMEDIVEEIVGDIQDEFDNEIPPIRKGKNRWIIEGDVHIEDVEKAIGTIFDEKKDTITIGGYIMSKLETIEIEKGNKIEMQGRTIEILNCEENRILLLAVTK
ncbi:hemolysin family protein [Bacillus sp. Brlt_9]|uniref:hemolysin family protein n=1 Tax=Bacillus sp. Brlt_9 TaxID=3110916 RepID=UPI003F7CCAD1